jgi:hypothetical protein
MFAMTWQLLVGTAVFLVPGFLLLLCLGVRERLWWAALAGPLTAGIVLVAAIVCGALGVRFDLISVGVVLLLVLGIAFAVRKLATRGRQVEAPDSKQADSAEPADESGAALSGVARLVATVTGLGIGIVGVGIGLLTWERGLRAWSTVSQEHDPIAHLVLTAYIGFTGKAAPWQIMPIDVVDGDPVGFYPGGLPSMAALVAKIFGDPVMGLNITTGVAQTVVFPLAAAALAVAVLRIAGIGRGWTELAGGIAAVVAVLVYRPFFAFAHDGGMLPNATAMVMVPGLVAAMLMLGKKEWAKAALIGIGFAGAFFIHPSAGPSVAMTLLAAWVGLLLTKSGRERLKGAIVPLVVAGAFTVLLALPSLLSAMGAAGTVTDWPPDIGPQSPREAIGNTLGLMYGGFLDWFVKTGQLAFAALTIGGIAAILFFRRGWPLLTAWVFWAGLHIAFQLNPSSGIAAALSGPFYRSTTRLGAHVYLLVPALAAVLLIFVAHALATAKRAERAERPGPARALIAIGLVAVVMLGLGVTTGVAYAKRNVEALATRYARPDFYRVDPQDDAAAKWLKPRVKPGELILNNGNDGSTIGYVRYELPLINTTSMGQSAAPYTVELLKKFREYPTDGSVRATLRRLNVRWVYVDSYAPGIGPDSNWISYGGYSTAVGLVNLDGLPGLSVAFRDDHVTVYQLDLDRLEPSPDDGR